jgi:hypothetical protein
MAKISDIQGVFDSNPLFKAMFRELLPDKKTCRWNTQAAEVNRPQHFPEATFEGVGVGTKVIGRHYNLIIEDDTLAPDDSSLRVEIILPDPEFIEQIVGFHRSAHALLVPKGFRGRMVVSTRWGDADLISYMQQNEKYKILDIPAEDENGRLQFTNFYTREQLDEIKAALGSYLYSCMFLNRPIPAGDRVFPDSLLAGISVPDDVMPPEYRYVITCDPAISERDAACETAITGCRHADNEVFVDAVVKGHLSPSETISAVCDLAEKHYSYMDSIIIESVAYQKALVHYLKQEMDRRRITVRVVEYASRSSKDVRIRGLQPLLENKHFYCRKGLVDVIRTQLSQYPYGRLVDVIDALSMQLVAYRGLLHANISRPTLAPEDTFGSIVDKLRQVFVGKHSGMNPPFVGRLQPVGFGI